MSSPRGQTDSLDQHPALGPWLDRLAAQADAKGVFGPCRVADGRLECPAKASAEPAFYRIEFDGGRLWVSLVMADRWQSESIEADLMHTGDKLEELLEEELVDLGYNGKPLAYEHFRSDDMLFTFRSPLPIDPASVGEDGAAAEAALLCLLGYEATFRQLGDMEADGEDD